MQTGYDHQQRLLTEGTTFVCILLDRINQIVHKCIPSL